MDDYNLIPSQKNLLIIFNKIKDLINEQFEKLNLIHKNLLITYLYRVILVAYFYFNNNNFIDQLYLNNYQDIFSFIVLLLPYYELNTSKNIKSLDELFFNENSQSKNLSSSYYIDHQLNFNSKKYLEIYFEYNIKFIIYTLENIHCSLMPNWLNIFPYTIDNYKESSSYKNCINIYTKKKFNLTDYSNLINENDENFIQINVSNDDWFKMGYSKFYGVIYSFMYMDIKPIKWMIYDINVDNIKVIPNIIYIVDKLELHQIVNKPWNKLTKYENNYKNTLWNDFIKSTKINKISLKSLVLFYLKWEKDNDNLTELNLSSDCLKIIKTNIDEILIDENNIDDLDENKIYSNVNNEIENCLNQIYKNLKFNRIYDFMYESSQRFKYTWYSYVCMDDNKNILNENDFFSNYFIKYPEIKEYYEENNKKKYFYPTPKNFYNFFKSLIHINISNKYTPLSLSPIWNNMSKTNKIIFINRLNNEDNIEDWFNIKKNLLRTYEYDFKNNSNLVNDLMIKLRNFFFYKTNTFIDVIFETMVYNGIFTYFKYNPKLTNNKILPDKNKNFLEWKKYILNNIDINSYSKSYHPFSNTILETQIYSGINTIEKIKESLWYTNFGANWIAQIQLYHHFINNRVLYITGATGAGKSTLTPFLLVYAVKIINFKNDAKVVCTQPRTQPVKDNSSRIAESMGYPILIKNDYSMDEISEIHKKTSKGEGIPQDINYIQYKHKKGTLIDEFYHPYLRLYTDGTLYNIILQSYVFKKIIKSNTELKSDFTNSNLFDIILIDEAHEHNTNMDLILTISKFATYINNQITLGIISATMDDDELIYRKYYEIIDDNFKYPLNISAIEFDKNIIDRRIHLSIPFGGMNFEVKEYPSNSMDYPKSIETFTDMKKINIKVIEILKHILNTTPGRINSDILIFQPGESDIKKLVNQINEQTPSNVLAIPFFSKLDNEILENIVKKIDKPNVRNKIRYPKNKYDISQINEIPKNELLPEGTYTRFVILATNIAEASITIDTFEYVIDIGNQKVNVYDYDTNQTKLLTLPIAVPNQKQRKGRVGRVKPGSVFYTYDRFKLSEKVGYKLNTENISSFIFDLVSSTNIKIINENNDPLKTSDINNYPKFLESQYKLLLNDDFISYYKFFENKGLKIRDITSKIIYPFSDGKYGLKTLEDENGEFYIIHPNEDYFLRDPLTLKIIDIKPNYYNKVIKVFTYGKLTGLVGDNNLLSPYGILVNNMSDFMEFIENSIDYTKVILDALTLGIDKNLSVFKNLIMFIVFKSSSITLKIPKYSIGKSDYLMMIKQIDSSLFDMFELNDIFDDINPEFNNFNDVVKNKVNILLFEKNNNTISLNFEEIKSALILFYQIKLKIDIIKKNSKYIKKNEFESIYDLLNQQLKEGIITNQYKLIFKKIIKYYSNEDKFLRKNVILRLTNEIKNIHDNNKFTKKIINKIEKLLINVSLFENENLIKINLENNKKYSKQIIDKINGLTEYDKMCFIIVKNFTQNILVKVTDTEFYINYYNSDINNIYSLETIFDKFIKTKVPNDIRNFYIFELGMNDANQLNNIMILNEYLINILNYYFNSSNINLKNKNLIFNKEQAIYKYKDKYTDIIKKIDKIKQYILNT